MTLTKRPPLARLYGFHWSYAYALLASFATILFLFLVAYWTTSEQDRTTKIVYTTPIATYYVNWPIVENRPILYGPQLRRWTSDTALPEGLTMDAETGVLSGTPLRPQPNQSLEIRAVMPSGALARARLEVQVFALDLG